MNCHCRLAMLPMLKCRPIGQSMIQVASPHTLFRCISLCSILRLVELFARPCARSTTAAQRRDSGPPPGSRSRTPIDPLRLPCRKSSRIALYQPHHPLETRPVTTRRLGRIERRRHWRRRPAGRPPALRRPSSRSVAADLSIHSPNISLAFVHAHFQWISQWTTGSSTPECNPESTAWV